MPEAYEVVAARYSVTPEVAKKAAEKLSSGEVFLLAVSGKLGAGKDTVAPLVMNRIGHRTASHEFFAKPLKDEVSAVIAIIAESLSPVQASAAVTEEQKVDLVDATAMVECLWEEVKTGVVSNSYVRTAATRFALQYWGTDVRRKQDTNYWVKRALAPTLEKLASGVSVYLTDARFTNEIDFSKDLGAFTLRLKVSPEEQAARILARDGILPSIEARTHVSETALDLYETSGAFALVVDTDKLSLEETVNFVVEELNRAH